MYNLSTKQLDDAINCRRDGEAGEDVGDKDDDDVGDASATTDGVNLSNAASLPKRRDDADADAADESEGVVAVVKRFDREQVMMNVELEHGME
ncbi:hypothetical protein ACHAWU_006793 [Discostella pseudostelligera]|uniref:Uncharacterized protein n=1 Tax=Discostella pseudostelligera TaxID=259834 RepID=A0ABD3MZ94_9STRA